MSTLRSSLPPQEKPDMPLASKGLAPLLSCEAKFIQQHLDPFLWNLLRGWKPAWVNNPQQFPIIVVPFTDSPRLMDPTVLLTTCFFSRKTKTSSWRGKLWRAQQMRPLNWLSHTAFPFYFQAFSTPKAICHRGITHTSRKYLVMYVCIYIYMCVHTHTITIYLSIYKYISINIDIKPCSHNILSS